MVTPTPAALTRVYYAYLPIWPLYFGFAAYQFIPGRRFLSAVNGVVAVVLTQAVTLIALSAASEFLAR